MYKIYQDNEGDLFAYIESMNKYTWIQLGKEIYIPKHAHDVDWFEAPTYTSFRGESPLIKEIKTFDDLTQYLGELQLSIMIGADDV